MLELADGGQATSRAVVIATGVESRTLGILAVGDVRQRSIKRVASATGDGATAIHLIHEYFADGPT